MDAPSAIRAAVRPSVRSVPPALRRFGLRGWLVALLAAVAAAVVTGIPTVMFENPWFVRMTPVRPQDVVVWVASALLIGLIAGTYAAGESEQGGRSAVAGGFLSYLAIGCPICNKVVVLLLGVGGALTFFGPAQIFLGIASVLLLVWTLMLRTDALAGGRCAVPAAQG